MRVRRGDENCAARPAVYAPTCVQQNCWRGEGCSSCHKVVLKNSSFRRGQLNLLQEQGNRTWCCCCCLTTAVKLSSLKQQCATCNHCRTLWRQGKGGYQHTIICCCCSTFSYVGCCEAVSAEAAACSTTKGDQVDRQARHLNSLAVCTAPSWAQIYSHKAPNSQQQCAAWSGAPLVPGAHGHQQRSVRQRPDAEASVWQ
jgi:hypothetical protein